VSLQTRRALLKQFAQPYRKASSQQKRVLLDAFAQATGYHRRYGMWLLNHAEQMQDPRRYARSRHYGPEVQRVFFLAWHAANRICTKRLMPYLSTWIDVLERHEHVQISEECRAQLLAMSVATADRLLRSQRVLALRGISTTKAGTLLKQQIPIRTYQQWNESRPGFLEADLVAHCGMGKEGCYLYTLTLTDVATGWTECLPLLNKSQEMVLVAFHRARTLFPFPILGIDTDCGGEFINEAFLAYCDQEHIIFTRGRPEVKNDQCFVEQKNGAIVRQVVGYDRLEGERAYQQVMELYCALRLYINGFQPSMKLLEKQREGKHVRRIYDAAKTPLQRLLLSGVLTAQKHHELTALTEALDPVRLFEQLKQLQQAVFGCAMRSSPFTPNAPAASTLRFSREDCTVGTLPAPGSAPDPAEVLHTLRREQQGRRPVLDWKRTSKDPFAGEWEQILAWLQANPERTCAEIFRALQHRSPGRYRPTHIRTLQRGIHKIRAHLLETREESWPSEALAGDVPADPPVSTLQDEADQTLCSLPAASASPALPFSQELTGAGQVPIGANLRKKDRKKGGEKQKASQLMVQSKKV
jgi:hypothetical protein